MKDKLLNLMIYFKKLKNITSNRDYKVNISALEKNFLGIFVREESHVDLLLEVLSLMKETQDKQIWKRLFEEFAVEEINEDDLDVFNETVIRGKVSNFEKMRKDIVEPCENVLRMLDFKDGSRYVWSEKEKDFVKDIKEVFMNDWGVRGMNRVYRVDG